MMNANEPAISPPMREAQKLLMSLFPDGYLLIAHHGGPFVEVTAVDPSGNGGMRRILNHISEWIESEKVGKIIASSSEVIDGNGNSQDGNGGRGANA